MVVKVRIAPSPNASWDTVLMFNSVNPMPSYTHIHTLTRTRVMNMNELLHNVQISCSVVKYKYHLSVLWI